MDGTRRLAAQPSGRHRPQVRVFQPSRHQLRLDFSGDVDQWSAPLLAAAVSAADAAPRADVLIDLGDVTTLYESALMAFSEIGRNAAHHQRSLTFIRLSEAALRTFDLHRYPH